MDILDIKDLSKYLHCSVMSIRRMIYNKKIPYFTIGNKYFFKKDSIDNYISNCEVQNMQTIYDTKIRSIR